MQVPIFMQVPDLCMWKIIIHFIDATGLTSGNYQMYQQVNSIVAGNTYSLTILRYS